jgi:hypothetical protein
MLLLGHMLYDAELQDERLRELPFDTRNYRGNLRVIRGAAVRMADRCAKLLGEVLDPREQAKAVLAKELAAIDVVDTHFPVIESGSEGGEAGPPPQNSHRTRKNGSDRPKKTGKGAAREYSVAETFVVSTLRNLGPMGTERLITNLYAGNGIDRGEAAEALAALRRDKKVLFGRVGRVIQNRLAE